MTDSETIKLFCTDWLLQNECSRGVECIFIHANMRDVNLCDELTEEEVFVKGSYNQGWQKKAKNKRGKSKNHFNQRQNANKDNFPNKSATRNNQNVPSTSSHQNNSNNLPSSSTGACKKVINKNTKRPQRTFTSPTSESDDENSKNLPNLQHSQRKDWINSREFLSKNNKNNVDSASNLSNEKNIKNQCEKNIKKQCDEVEEATNVPASNKEVASKQVQRDSDIATALTDSREKVCGICFETIMQKAMYERRFGILPNCNHCFCLTCIRKWRQAKQFENNIIRACPECRVTSDFVCPSTYWVETEAAKEKLITNYKTVLSKKDCKYFRRGNGSCPFGNKCFYLHALTDGTKVDVGPPPSQRFENEFTDEIDLIQKLVLLEYFHNEILGYSDDDDDDDDDDDLLDYMFWESDEDVYLY